MNIVIVGGGTAGWLCAFILAQRNINKTHNITLISSSEIGTIGVGESTTGIFTSLFISDEIDFIDFLKQTDSTIKTAVLLKNWNKDKKDFYSPIDGSVTSTQGIDSALYYAVHEDLPRSNCSIWSLLAKENKTSLSKRTLSLGRTHPALHIDTYKTAEFLKNKSTQKGVTYIDSKVENVILNESGFIEKLTLSNGKEVTGDFFIDASGFSRKLISKMGSSFVSYKKNLPVNKALTFSLEKDSNEDYSPVTVSHALSSGWMWKIPTRKRYGIGYVYCDSYLSEEMAFVEVQRTIGKQIKDYRFITFESGRLDKLWNKNCLCIGIGGSFLEPLQATSIHTTILQINDFVQYHLKDTFSKTYSEYSENLYNINFNYILDNFRNFVSMHYGGGRDDSQFWKEINITDEAKTIIGLSKHRLAYRSDFRMNYGIPGPTTYELCSYILDGIGCFTKEKTKELFDENPNMYYDAKRIYNEFYNSNLESINHDYFSPKELDHYINNLP